MIIYKVCVHMYTVQILSYSVNLCTNDKDGNKVTSQQHV